MIRDEILVLVGEELTAAQAAGDIPQFAAPAATIEHPQRPEHGDFSANLPLRIQGLAKMKAIESESGSVTGISPLTVMQTLTEAVSGKELASGSIRIFSASVAPERISAEGTALSFEAANRYAEALGAAGIGEVRMADVKSRVGDGVGFSLVILR